MLASLPVKRNEFRLTARFLGVRVLDCTLTLLRKEIKRESDYLILKHCGAFCLLVESDGDSGGRLRDDYGTSRYVLDVISARGSSCHNSNFVVVYNVWLYVRISFFTIGRGKSPSL